MTRKRIALLLALALALTMTACGAAGLDNAGSGSASSGSASFEEDASSAAGSAVFPEEDEAQPPDGSGDGSGAGKEEQPEKPAAEAPAGNPPQSSPSGSGQQAPKPAAPASSGTASQPSGGSGLDTEPERSVDLAAFYDSLSSGEDFPAMMALTGETLDALYTGLSDLSLRQCLVYTPMISSVGAEIALVEVESDADVQAVKDIFQARIDYQIEQGAFYPATVEIWENSARIVSSGRYVMLACFSDCDAIVSSFNALVS